MTADIIIIGAGIIGCAIARELSRYVVNVVVVDDASDVAEGATKANSGIIHAGYDAVPGTKKAYYNSLGAKIYPKLCASLGIKYNQCGALVLGFTKEDRKTINTLYERGCQNGVEDLQIIDCDDVLSLEPNVNTEVLCALNVLARWCLSVRPAKGASYSGLQTSAR